MAERGEELGGEGGRKEGGERKKKPNVSDNFNEIIVTKPFISVLLLI